MENPPEPPPLDSEVNLDDEINLLDDEPGPTPTMTPTSPSPPAPAEELILSDDPITDDLESPFEDPGEFMKPVPLDDGPEFEPVSLSSEPSAALPDRDVVTPSLISPVVVNGDHEPMNGDHQPTQVFSAPPATNGGGAFFEDDDDEDDLFPSTTLRSNQAPVLTLDQTASTDGTPSPASTPAAPEPVVVTPMPPAPVVAPTPVPVPAPAAAPQVQPTHTFSNDPQPMSKEEEEAERGDEFFLEIRVHDPAKVGDGMGAFVSYKVTTKTNLPAFRKSNYNVSRRFSDFLGLHQKLVNKHMVAGRIVPPAPEKSAMGAMGVKLSKEDTTSQDFVERRRASLERFLNRTAAHSILKMDPDFRDFLEMDGDLPRAMETRTFSPSSIGKFFSNLEDKVNKIAYRVDEADAWFEEKAMMVENLDNQLRKLHASLESLVAQRRELVGNTALFAKSCALLSNAEEHTGLARALSHLAEVEEKVEQVHVEQANGDFYQLAETIRDYVSLLSSVKDVFNQRVKIYTNWRNTMANLAKKREAAQKLQQQGKTDKLRLTEDEIKELEKKVESGQKEFEACSKTIRTEMERFEATRIKDFKATIISYLEILMDSQQKLVKHWEQFVPEAKAIA